MNIKLIPHQEIDKVKWNSCVHYATNGNIFGYKWYLDAVAKEWDALVEGDYESIMPLFITEKEDLLEQPKLLREAGIYSIHVLAQKRIQNFIDAIPEQFTNHSFQFNEGIQISEHADYSLSSIKNYQLVLLDDYQVIKGRFSSDLKAQLEHPNIKKLLPSSNVKPELIAQLFKDNSPFNRENEIAFHTYQRIMYNALHRGWGATFGVTDRDKNLLSAGFFIYGQGRMMQLLSATSPKGKELGAYDYLIDNILRSHAGRPLVLDFNSTDDFGLRFGSEESSFLRMEKEKVKRKAWKFWS